MTNEQEEVAIPARYSRVDPWVISSDTDAGIEFLAATFDAQETPVRGCVDPMAASVTPRLNSALQWADT